VRALAALLLVVALPAHGQEFTCGSFKAESRKTPSGTEWTIARGQEKAKETAMLKSGPRFDCVAGQVLAVEFTTSSGNGFVDLRFPDGNEIGYGGQIVRRKDRFVLPIQAKARIEARFRGAFDYHCRFNLPGDPIPEASRGDCLF
jgi:hypothetical protein